jgi:hypothetical protein
MAVARSGFVAFVLTAIALSIGAFGYHATEGLPWLDSFLNASMILSGMGPVDPVKTEAGKIFATCYAIFSGVAFLSIVALFLAPALHRFLHKFHLDVHELEKEEDLDEDKADAAEAKQ